MGLGTFGTGGSSLPLSNLSALATPFSVDRSNSKPNANPLVNFSDPPYAVPFNSSFSNWQYPHLPSASRPGFYPNHGSEVDSIRTTCLPSSDNPNPNFSAAASDSFTFLQYSSEIPSKRVGDKPFYSPFVSPVIDDDAPLAALNETSYDLLPTSCAPLDGPIQAEYSDLEYMPQWNSSWNRLSDLEQGKQIGLDGGIFSEEKNIAGSYVYNNYMKQEDASVISSKKYVDLFGSESQIPSPSKGKLHDKVQNLRFVSGDSARTSISGSSILPQSHVQGLFPQPAANIWNHQISYDSPPLESSTNSFLSVQKSAPPLVIRLPRPVDTSSRMPNAVPSEDEKSSGNVAAINRKGFGFHDSPNQREPHSHVQRTNHIFVASSSTEKEEKENKHVTKDVLDYISDSGMEFQLPDTNVPYGFTFTNDGAKKAFTSVENSPETLDNGTSVDSPCWKGAPASCFSFSEGSEVCNGMNLQKTQSFPFSTSDTIKMYEENGYSELGSLLCPEKFASTNFSVRENSSSNDVKAGFNNPILSSNNGVQFCNDVKSRKEYGFPHDPDSKPGHTKELGLEKHEVTSETEFKSCTGWNTSNASVVWMKSASCVPCSSEIDHTLVKLDATESTPKMNVQMMVNTIHHLSELLLFYWSNDVSPASQKDHQAIKHAINNLDACVSKKIPHMTPTQESRFPQDTSCERTLDEGVTAARFTVTKEANASSDGRLHHNHVYEGKRNNNLSGKKVEKCPDFNSLRDDAEIMKDDKIVQAMKELLKEGFIGEEQMQSESETLLYKNLWLEAEAALCSISYRDRFNRMKIEMEKQKPDNVKNEGPANDPSICLRQDVETREAVEKVPSFKADVTRKVTPDAKDKSMSDISIHDYSFSTMTEILNDVETSVMTRFDILKRRDHSPYPVNPQVQRLTDVDVGFAENRNHFPFVGDQSESGRLNSCDEFHSQKSACNSKVDEFGPYMSSNYIGSSDDQVLGSGRRKRMGSGIISGWRDNYSPDWEHMLKDEFAG